MVAANWRNNNPDRPGTKAIGTNTDNSAKLIAITGPVIWAIAFLVASAGVRFGSCSITRSTFSTTTIASSTTTPIANTMASKETVFTK
jgi:hypothetical protein